MHIPDSVLSPSTCVAAGFAMTPVWTLAARRVRWDLGTRQIPLLGLGAAFCFTIMMFNVPAPGGTTAHPIAGTLLAVALGPWAACIGISVALLIQALFFGDGGLLAYGANCFTMAFVMPFVGYSVYRLVSSASGGRIRLPIAAGFAAFVGINAAALIVAVLLGIQPALFHEANGHALYFPFGLHITLPAMLGVHLIVAGPAEAIVTGLVVSYLRTAGIPLYGLPETANGDRAPRSTHVGARSQSIPGDPASQSPDAVVRSQPHSGALAKGARLETLAVGLLALLALTPLGLLAKGEAWGEWDAHGMEEQTRKQFGPAHAYVPREISASSGRAYGGIPGLQDYASGDGTNKLGYVGAGLLGAASVLGLSLAAGRATALRRGTNKSSAQSAGRNPYGLQQAPESGAPLSTQEQSSGLGGPSGHSGRTRADGAAPSQHSIRNPQSSTINPQSSTINPQSSTINPQSSTINPQPSTINHRPSTITLSPPHHLPIWLSSGALVEDVRRTSGRPNRFIERTLAELTAAAAASFQSETLAHQEGLLQRLDTRGKIVALLTLVLATCLSHRPDVIVGLYIVALMLSAASRLPLLQMIRRVWLAAPLFAAAIAIPLALNTVTPGHVIATLWRYPAVAISLEGVVLGAVITLRIATAISFALLLTWTTRWTVLLASLRAMRFPRTFLQVLAMTYRYLAIALQTAADAFMARKSRTVGVVSRRDGQGFVGNRVGALLSKSLAMSEEVHSAMLSRAFRGEMRTLEHSRWRVADTLWTLALVVPAAIAAAVR